MSTGAYEHLDASTKRTASLESECTNGVEVGERAVPRLDQPVELSPLKATHASYPAFAGRVGPSRAVSSSAALSGKANRLAERGRGALAPYARETASGAVDQADERRQCRHRTPRAISRLCRQERTPSRQSLFEPMQGKPPEANYTDHEVTLQVVPARYVLLKLASAVTGYSVKAMERKIERGDWLQDRVWRRAPDGRILLDIMGYQKWVEGR